MFTVSYKQTHRQTHIKAHRQTRVQTMRDEAESGYVAWCNGRHVCFPSLPPMPECRFESWLRLELSGFGTWHFLKLVVRGFLRVLRFSPFLHRLMVQPIR